MHGRPHTNEPSEDYVIIPPDGGWGWVIVISAFYCQVIIDGIQLSFGMILKEIADEYKVPYSSVSLIGSLMYGVHYLSGPICAGLSYHFGDRPVSMIGSVLIFVGLASPYFFTLPIYALYLLIGILSGVGLCFVNMNSLIITTLYFSKKRILAMGIVVCGTGAGTIVFSALANIVLKKMDWKTVCFIEGIIALSMFIAAATFRPLKPVLVQTKNVIDYVEIEEEVVEEDDDDDDEAEEKHPVKSRRVYYVRDFASAKTSREGSISSFAENTGLALEDVATSFIQSSLKRSVKHFKNVTKYCAICSAPHRKLRRIIKMNPNLKRTVLSEDGQHGVHRISVEPDNVKCKFFGGCEVWSHILSTMLDCRILKSYSFFAYCIGGAMSASALIIVLFYEKVRLLDEGFGEDDVMWYMIGLGSANMTWRLVLGAVSTLPRVNYHSLNVIGLLLGGIFTAVSVLSHSKLFTYVCGAMYGLAIACFAVFYPVILLELVGSDRVSNATGVAMLFMGVLSTIGAPLSGVIMELSGSIDSIFYIAGFMFVISGIIFIFITGRRHARVVRTQQSPNIDL